MISEFANPAASQGNVIWAAGQLSMFSRDMRVIVGGSNRHLI